MIKINGETGISSVEWGWCHCLCVCGQHFVTAVTPLTRALLSRQS